MKNRIKGIMIAFLAVIILSPDSTLITLAGDVDGMTLVFWRGISYAIGVIIIVYLMYGSKSVDLCINIGTGGVIIGLLSGVATATFVFAIQNTSIAHTLIIISTAPVMIAIFSWFMIKEKINLASAASIVLVFIGIYIVMSDNFGESNIKGDLFALFTAIVMGITFTMTRKYKDINMIPTNIIGGFVAALLAFLYVDTLYLPTDAMLYTLLSGIILSISFSMIVIAPRYAPATDVGMIIPLETVFGSFIAWIVLNNVPSLQAFIGGFIVLFTLILYAWYCSKIPES